MRSAYFTVARLGGRAVADFAAVVYRSPYRDFPNDEDFESWVLRHEGGASRVIGGGVGWVTGFWAAPAPSRRVYVCGAMSAFDGFSIGSPDADGAYRWEPVRFSPARGVPELVWGVDEDFVFVWGGGLSSLPDDPAFLWHWDGRSWRELPSPGRIYAMHGDRSTVFAVGFGGLVARWDGNAWHRMAPPGRGSIQFVYAASADDACACGLDGVVYTGSAHGWVEAARATTTLTGVAIWRGKTLLAARHQGFLELTGDALTVARKDLDPRMLHVGEQLLWLDAGCVLGSEDFERFDQLALSSLEPLLDASHHE